MENERQVYFSSKTKIDWDSYREMNYIRYKRINILCLFLIVFICISAAALFIIKGLDATICTVYFCCAFFMVFIGAVLKKQSVTMHGQQKIKYGKDVIEHEIEFSDRIYIRSSCDIDRSYDYSLIEKLYETENYYLLVMPYGVTILVDKHTLKGLDGVEFRHFIFDKCYSLKEPLFKKVKDGRKMLKGLTVLAFFIAVVVLMLYFFQITPENWRELGRNPQYSSSQQSTSENISNSSK